MSRLAVTVLTVLFVALALACAGAVPNKNNQPPVQNADGKPAKDKPPVRDDKKELTLPPADAQQNAARIFADPFRLQLEVGQVGRIAEKSHHTVVEILGPTEAILKPHSFFIDQTIPTMPQSKDTTGPEYIVSGLPTAGFKFALTCRNQLTHVYKVTGERTLPDGRRFFVIEPVAR
jgi:hypothetical protein